LAPCRTSAAAIPTAVVRIPDAGKRQKAQQNHWDLRYPPSLARHHEDHVNPLFRWGYLIDKQRPIETTTRRMMQDRDMARAGHAWGKYLNI
jgi:hypothetical protein